MVSWVGVLGRVPPWGLAAAGASSLGETAPLPCRVSHEKTGPKEAIPHQP